MGHNPFASSTDNANAQPTATETLKSGQFRFNYGPPENGQYPLHMEAQDLGSLVPWSKLNAIVGIVPVLGQVATGRDGKGIMAIDYTLKGTIAKPDVSIKKAPLTPGIFKNTLGADKDHNPTNRQ